MCSVADWTCDDVETLCNFSIQSALHDTFITNAVIAWQHKRAEKHSLAQWAYKLVNKSMSRRFFIQCNDRCITCPSASESENKTNTETSELYPRMPLIFIIIKLKIIFTLDKFYEPSDICFKISFLVYI